MIHFQDCWCFYIFTFQLTLCLLYGLLSRTDNFNRQLIILWFSSSVFIQWQNLWYLSSTTLFHFGNFIKKVYPYLRIRNIQLRIIHSHCKMDIVWNEESYATVNSEMMQMFRLHILYILQTLKVPFFLLVSTTLCRKCSSIHL